MADFFVKTNGNDANNGTTWALAKLTVQAGLNLCTTAGDRCVVAAGKYMGSSNYGLTAPSAGTRASPKTLIGDWGGTIADGGSNYSGVTGYVILDASSYSGSSYGPSTNKNINGSNNWAYWNLEGIWFTGGAGCRFSGSSQTVNDSISIKKCIFEGFLGPALELYYWTTDPDTYAPITIERCILLSRWGGNGNYSNALYVALTNKQTSHYTNPQIKIIRSVLWGEKYAICYEETASRYLKMQIQNSLVGTSFSASSLQAQAAWTNSASGMALAIIYDDCLVCTGGFWQGSGSYVGTYNDTASYLCGNGGDRTGTPTLPYAILLWPGSNAVDTDSTPTSTTFPDLLGTAAVVGTQDYGAQELESGKYLKEPTMSYPPGGGGGGPMIGGRLVR